MLKVITTLTAICCIAALYYLQNSSGPNNTVSTAPAIKHGLPWQIETTGNNSRVFGITLGETTLAEAMMMISREHELAILAKLQEDGALELFYRHFNAGYIKGKLLLVVDTDRQLLGALKADSIGRKTLDNGTSQYTLSEQQQLAVATLPIRSITFVPVARLTQDMIEQQFGPPVRQITTRKTITHNLYPALGLDIIINSKGKDLLQYVAPKQFSALEQSISSH